MKAQHAGLALAFRDAFDLLDIADLETGIRSVHLLHQQRHKNTPQRVGMDTAASAPLKSRQKERRAGRWLQVRGLPNILPRCGWIFGRVFVKHKDVFRLDELLLDSRRSDVDIISRPDRRASAST